MTTQTVTLFSLPLTKEEIEKAKAIIKQDYLERMAKKAATSLTLAIVYANAEFFKMYADRLELASPNGVFVAALESHLDLWYNRQIKEHGQNSMLDRSAFEIKVIGETVFTFEYSQGVKDVLNKNTAIYKPYTDWEDKIAEVDLARRANKATADACGAPMFDKIIQG